jgi:Tat protein translocase TatB subunit
MLNVGPLELLVVLAVALIVVGPERLPELARSVGRALGQLRQVQDEVRDMVTAGVDDEMRQAATDFKKATGDIAKSSGVGELGRKSGRAAGPSKAATRRRGATPSTRGASTAATETPATRTAATEPVAVATETDTAASEAAATERAASAPESETGEPVPTDAEVAGPPADRLVEDGAATADAPAGATDDAEEPDTER